MNKTLFKKWLEALGKAWVNRDPKAAANICADDVVYYETPFGNPLKSKIEIEEIWKEVPKSQKDIQFDYDIISINTNVGVAHWKASFTKLSSNVRVELDGVFVVKLDKNGLYKEFRQWWIIKPNP